MPVIPQLVMHRSHVFLPTFAVNPEKPLLPLRKALSPLIGIPCLPNSRVANAVTRERGTLMLPCLSLTGVFSSFRSSHFQAARTQVQRQEISASPNSSLPAQGPHFGNLCCQIGSFWRENRAEGTNIFAASQEPKTESHTAVVRESANLTPSKRRHRQRGQVKISIHIHLRRKTPQ